MLVSCRRYGALRRRLCVCFVWWMSAVFVFYGLAVSAHALAGSPHANYALVAAAELPALLLNTLLLDRVGRRPLLTAALLITAAALIALSALPQGHYTYYTSLLHLMLKTNPLDFDFTMLTSLPCMKNGQQQYLHLLMPQFLVDCNFK